MANQSRQSLPPLDGDQTTGVSDADHELAFGSRPSTGRTKADREASPKKAAATHKANGEKRS